MVVSGVVYTDIYSAESTIEYCLQLNYELTFEPILVELVLYWEPILSPQAHRFITYKAALSALTLKELERTRK